MLKAVQAPLAQVDGQVDELKPEMQALRTSQNGIRQEITGVYQEIPAFMRRWFGTRGRLDRIEQRLELSDAPRL